MSLLENSIYRKQLQGGKEYLPNEEQAGRKIPSPYPAHKLVIKKKSLHSIMVAKGWKTYTQVASALGFTRQYVTMVANGVPVSSEFIIRMALCLGNQKYNWHVHYEIAPRGYINENHPTWNEQKYKGQIPYEKYSISADLRKDAYPVEKQLELKFYNMKNN